MVSVAANVLATIGTVLWCIQMIPQIIRNYKVKDCEGLPPMMLFLWSSCSVPFSIYFVSIKASIPVQIQPQCFGALCLVTFAQSLYYPPVSKSKRVVCVIIGAFVAVAVGLEVGFIIPLKSLYIREGEKWQHLIFGILASILLAIGLLPPYFEAYKRQGRIIGINFGFLAMDLSGALFSLASLAVDSKDLDVMGCILYSICASLEIGIVISHLVWCMRFKWFGKSNGKQIEDEENQEEKPKDNEEDDCSSLDLQIENTVVDDSNVENKTTDKEVDSY